MLVDEAVVAAGIRRDRALSAVSVCAIVWLLGPGIGVIDTILGPAAGSSQSLTWLEQAAEAPEDAFIRAMTALGLVLAVRLLAGLLLALIARVPGRTGVRAARWSFYVTPPHARRFVRLIISVSLSSWTGVALGAPALAATHPAATVVPPPVLAPPEATLQTWPDLGRPGTDLPSSPIPSWSTAAPAHTGERPWPDLGRPGTAAPTTPAPTASGSLRQPSTNSPRTPSPSDRPSRPPAGKPQPGTPPPVSAAPTTTVVVAPGDCLWTLAERDLEGQGRANPSPSDVAAATEKWWLANRTTIGADPDHLVPGELLRPPSSQTR